TVNTTTGTTSAAGAPPTARSTPLSTGPSTVPAPSTVLMAELATMSSCGVRTTCGTSAVTVVRATVRTTELSPIAATSTVWPAPAPADQRIAPDTRIISSWVTARTRGRGYRSAAIEAKLARTAP